MKPARLIIAGIAGLAGLGSLLVSGRGEKPKPAPVPQPVAVIAKTEVLVAKSDLSMGTSLSGELIGWVEWPQEMASPSMIQRSARPDAIEEFKGGITRAPFFANEPIREEKVIKGAGSGFLSAILPKGKRAVAISIDSRGASSAGGFVLPNDYVDVLAVLSIERLVRSATGYSSATVLRNVRVLAIGQNIQEKNGERVVVGETATLEVTPEEAEQLMLFQRRGSLSLVLRSMADANQPEGPLQQQNNGAGVTIVRFGIPQEVSPR